MKESGIYPIGSYYGPPRAVRMLEVRLLELVTRDPDADEDDIREIVAGIVAELVEEHGLLKNPLAHGWKVVVLKRDNTLTVACQRPDGTVASVRELEDVIRCHDVDRRRTP